MPQPYQIDHPDQLAAHNDQSTPQKERLPHGTDNSDKIKLSISLLQPLTDPSVLAASRNPTSKYCRDEAGNRLPCMTNNEYLDLTSLGKLWRAEWTKISPTSVGEVCFDLALPRLRSGNNSERAPRVLVHWETGMSSEGGLAVITQDVINLVVLLATVLRMRGGSKEEIRFSLREDEEERMMASTSTRLKATLERLSRSSGVGAVS